jgi:hypothetical protein
MVKPVPASGLYEYQYVEVAEADPYQVSSILNGYGQEAWRVVTFVHSGGFYRFLLTRSVVAPA